MRRFLLRTSIALTSGVLLVAGTYLTTKLFTATPLTEGCTVRAEGRETKLDVSQAENASLIAALSVRQDYPPRAATVALAAAYQESGLRNLDHGDRDSLGLFQQRPSQGWGSRAQISDPYYSTQTFYDHLMNVKGYDRMPVAQAAQRVQNSADGAAYAQHERDAKALSDAFTGRSEASFSCRLAAEPTPSAYAVAAGSTEAADSTEGPGPTDSERSAGGGNTSDDSASDDGAPDAGSADEADEAEQPDQPEQPDGDRSESEEPNTSDGSNGPNAPGGEVAGSGNQRAAEGSDDATASAPAKPGRQSTDASGPAAADKEQEPTEAPGSTGTAPDAPDGSAAADTENEQPRSAAEAVQRELQQAFGSRNGPQDPGSQQASPGAPGPQQAPGALPGAPGTSGGQPGGTAGQPMDTEGNPEQTERPANPPATDVEVSDDGKQVRVQVENPEVGWAIAHWSVANTQRFGITEVDYDSRTWRAAKSGDGWVTDKDSPADGGAVRIRLG